MSASATRHLVCIDASTHACELLQTHEPLPVFAHAGLSGVQHCGDGKRHGQGIYTYPNGKICSCPPTVSIQCARDIAGRKYRHARLCAGDVFDGSFIMGKREGHGSYKYSAGGRYEGEWKNDCMHGKGKFVYRSGNVYEGEWSNDVPHGKGVFIEGKVVYDIEHDNGTETMRQRNEAKTQAASGSQGGGWFR